MITSAVGGIMNMFEVTTLGQPFEVLKTQMASHRGDSMAVSFRNVWARGGILGCQFFLILLLALQANTGLLFLFSLPRIDPLGMD